MNKPILKYALIALFSMFFGYIGSLVQRLLDGPRTVEVARARRFELLNTAGKVIGHWGIEEKYGGPEALKGAHLVFTEPDGRVRFDIGIQSGYFTPSVAMTGRDGQDRCQLGLGFNDDPMLILRDSSTWRVHLGAFHGDAPSPAEDDWGVALRSRTGARCHLGTHAVNTSRSQAFLTVEDGNGRNWSVPPSFHYEIERIPVVPRH